MAQERPGFSSSKRLGVMLVAAVWLGLFVVSLPAGATTPGVNGQIAYDQPFGSGPVSTANSDGTHVRQVTDANSCCAAWSPDGSRLLVSGPNSDGMIATSILNADGTDFHTLPLLTPGLGLACTVWSPDGKYCAAQGGSMDPSVNASVEGVYRVNVNNGSAVRLTTGDDIPGGYSPDGSRIVFGRYDPNSSNNNNGLALYIMNANGTGLHKLITEIFGPVNDGSWSPQNQIVFSRHVTANVPGSIWVINSDGTGLHQINVRGLDCGGIVGCHEPQWSPDGTKIIFATNSPQGSFVYTMKADGTGLKRIAVGDDPVWGTHPAATCTPTEACG
jgi:Tol biopolymer transport system component